MTTELVACDTHGDRQMTFICGHIHAAGKTGTSPGFNFVPHDSNDYPDAWCDECEAFLQATGGEWTDDGSRSPEIKLLCSECYSQYRDLAAGQGRLRAH